MQRSAFGKLPDGSPVELFTLTNTSGMTVQVTNYGTIITSWLVPDRTGQLGDAVLGFDTLAPYLEAHPYFGCTVGRVANRIAGASLEVDGVRHELTRNSGRHHLHGGTTGFDRALWGAALDDRSGASIRFRHRSSDGDQGYPGQLDVEVLMTLDDDDALTMTYTAITDRPTPVSLTNHSYFNLACGGDVLQHELQLQASHYTPTDAELLPLGTVVEVTDTPLDFRQALPIGQRIGELTGALPGYDHNYVIDRGSGAARLHDPGSGRVLIVDTTEPGIQCYTGNALDGSLIGKRGVAYRRHAGICLEPQRYPDALRHEAFPDNILRPGETYRQQTTYRFSVESATA